MDRSSFVLRSVSVFSFSRGGAVVVDMAVDVDVDTMLSPHLLLVLAVVLPLFELNGDDDDDDNNDNEGLISVENDDILEDEKMENDSTRLIGRIT